MHFSKGQFLVELLVAIGLTSVILPALLTGFVASREGRDQEGQRLVATGLAREAQDATRSVRSRTNGWDYFTNGTYYPRISGSVWELAAGVETIGDFTRQVEISDVRRDSAGIIVSSGGTIDPSARKVVIRVLWEKPRSSNVTSTFYVTRYSSLVFVDTTDAEFNAGVRNGTVVTNTAGGEVTLGAGGGGDWCAPNLSINPLDLPKNGVANAISAIEGKVAAGTGENSSGVAFASIGVANTNPPTSQVSGTFDGYKTNGVFTETNYAYLATDNNSKEVVIIDLTQQVGGKYVEVGYFNTPSSNADGLSVYVAGNIGFLTTGSRLYTFNLTSKTGSRAQLASIALPAAGTKVVVVGQYAYISIAGHTKELQIVNFNGAGTTLANHGYSDVNGEAAYDVAVNLTGTRAYLATAASTSLREFFIINTTNKSSSNPSLPQVGSYDASGMSPKGVAITTGNRAILVGTSAEEYQVINIANEATPVRCGGLQLANGVNDVAAVLEADGDAYSYIITGDSSNELKIIEGGPGGTFVTSGSFESRTFTMSEEIALNQLTFTATEPLSTDVKLQIAINGDNSTWSYFGPDGTGSTFFQTQSPIPLSLINGTYVRYKAFLEGDGLSSPILSDVNIYYSP
ncbi:MAG: hypothetical protein NUV69_01395 [Candidatus Curtissbacteria bacterium]|nr:hypothetical protein [Candidatus Curtissbacteria bacterium]